MGTFVIQPSGWPDAWLEYAQKSYPAASFGHGPALCVQFAGMSPHLEPQPGVVEGSIACARRKEMLRIFSRYFFLARYAPQAEQVRFWIPPAEGLLKDARVTVDNVLRALVAWRLPRERHGLMFHGASGVHQGHGLLFAGLSTAGKTTLSTGWKETTYLSDDISLIDGLDGQARLLPSPFFGVFAHPGAHTTAPLSALCLLSHAEERTSLRRLSPAEALPSLIRHVVSFSSEPSQVRALLDRAAELVERVPVIEVQRHLSSSSDDVCRAVVEHLS